MPALIPATLRAARPALTLPAPLAGALFAALTACSAGLSAAPHHAPPRVSPRPSVSVPGAASADGDAGRRSGVTPVRVTIPSIRVNSPLIALGRNSDDTVQVPSAAQGMMAGWYTGSAVPGQPGVAVVIGHNDTRYGRAVFHDLHLIKRGADIAIGTADGRITHYTVTGTERVPKTNFPTERVYGPQPVPVLRLITCDGPLGSDGHPVDNLIVSAGLRSDRADAAGAGSTPKRRSAGPRDRLRAGPTAPWAARGPWPPWSTRHRSPCAAGRSDGCRCRGTACRPAPPRPGR